MFVLGGSRVASTCAQSVDCLSLARERSASMQRLVAQQPATFQIVLPLPPGVNNQYVSVGRRRVLSAPAKSFNRDIAKLIAAQRISGQLSTATEQALASSLLGVYLVFFFQTPHRRDLDGGLKICLDALARTIGFDDRAVVDLHLSKKIDPLRPRVEVDIETISEWEFDQTYLYLGREAPEP
jgi:crossover junction endodeoxyribonuclease RusA